MGNEGRAKIRRRIRASAALTGVITALAMLALVMVAIRLQVASLQQDHIDTRLQRLTNILTSVNNSLDRLNNLNLPDCNMGPDGAYDSNLASMHRELFYNNVINDIGFYRGDWLACTTGRGVISTPMRDKPADMTSPRGNRYWFNQLLYLFVINGRYEGTEHTLIRRGNYNTVVNLEELSDEFAWRDQWQLTVGGTDQRINLLGNSDVADKATDWRGFGAGTVVQEGCIKTDLEFCLRLRSSLSDWLPLYGGLLTILVPICLVAGATAGTAIARELGHRYSDRGRVMRGLKTGAFSIVFQPVVDLRTGRNVGCEATARFTDRFGSIPRAEFIRIIRKQGLTWEFTEAMIRLGLDTMNRYRDWPDRFRVSLNIFPEDIVNGAALALRDLGLFDHQKFRYFLEIREDSVLDSESAKDTLALLEQTGFWVGLDHFGTGYSNLQTLQSINCRAIKIDPSFINNIENRNLRASLIPGIVAMAHGQNIAVIADGIENLRQVDVLLETGVIWGQGDALGEANTIEILHQQTLASVERPIGTAQA